MNLSGSPFDFIIAFLGGLFISFSPCLYPLIPVIAGYIGLNPTHSKFKSFLLSFSYATGIATTYSFLGILAVLTGRIFGVVSSHPITNILVGIILILFGLNMLELIYFKGIKTIQLPKLKKTNYFTVFFLGLVSGLIVSPCTAPVLGSILVYLTTKKNLLYGGLLLFSFAYGMSLVLVLVGTFSGFLLSLPKAGKWLDLIKKLAAGVIILAGIVFVVKGIGRILI